MICKLLKTMAMVCLLAAATSISVGMASEEGAIDLGALNAVDEVSMTDDVEEVNNTTSLNSTNQSSNESSAENALDLSAFDVVDEESMTDDVDEVNNATSSNLTDQSSNESSSESSAEDVNASVVDLSTLESGSKTAEDSDVTVISYMPPSNETDEAEVTGMEVTDVRILGNVLEAPAAENVAHLSTLGEGSGASDATDGAEPIDVRVLGNVLGAPATENVTNLSTLGEGSTALDVANATETNYTSLSNATTVESEATDVKVLSEVLGID
jgi:hypothetical protein